jgi:WD40 repeat protein
MRNMVIRLARDLASIVLGSAVILVSCSPMAPIASARTEKVIAWLDSYAVSGQVRLSWTIATKSDCFECPPKPVTGRAEILQSSVGPLAGYKRVFVTDSSRPDSTVISGLVDGRTYWFRINVVDEAGKPLAVSNPIMTIPGPVTTPAISVDLAMVGTFCWSPNGDLIAYVNSSAYNQTNLNVLDVATRLSRSVTAYAAGDERLFDAAWSPDGREIAYTHTPSLTVYLTDYRVFSVALSDSTIRVLTPGPVDHGGSWGRNGVLYFCRGTKDAPNIPEIWRSPAMTGSAQPITSDQQIYKYSPSIRPTDDLIVYEGARVSGPHLDSDLFLVSPATGISVPITSDWWSDSAPAWAPDGRHVVFVSSRSGHAEVWSIDTSRGSVAQLTRSERGQATKSVARWSPDGRHLAVSSVRGTWTPGCLEIYQMLSPIP